MKVKRHRHQKHCMTFYRQHYGYKPPYQMLIDGTFCRAALKFQVNIMEQMPKYLDAEVHYFTTKCVIEECEALGTLLFGPLKVLKQYHVFPCRHGQGTSPQKCFRTTLRAHKHQFIVATQDQEISDMVRQKAGVPLAYIAYKAITIEEPSDHSRDIAEKKLSKKLAPSDYAMSVIQQMKKAEFGEKDKTKLIKKTIKKKTKGANPLSCKKKKKRTAEEIMKLKTKKKDQKKKSESRKKVNPLSGSS